MMTSSCGLGLVHDDTQPSASIVARARALSHEQY